MRIWMIGLWRELSHDYKIIFLSWPFSFSEYIQYMNSITLTRVRPVLPDFHQSKTLDFVNAIMHFEKSNFLQKEKWFTLLQVEILGLFGQKNLQAEFAESAVISCFSFVGTSRISRFCKICLQIFLPEQAYYVTKGVLRER